MKKVIVWLVIIITFQVGLYSYIDCFMLSPQVHSVKQTVLSKDDIDKFYSYDRAYYAQNETDGIKIFNTHNNKLIKDFSLSQGETITYFSWLPQRNIALVGRNLDGPSSTTITLEAINPDTGSAPVMPRIIGLALGSRILDVAYSTQTNVINMLIRHGNNKMVYRTDANNHLHRVILKTTHIRRIAGLINEDLLIYDDILNGCIYSVDTAGKSRRISPGLDKYALLGVSNNDRIYIGKLNSKMQVTMVMVSSNIGNFLLYKQLDSPSALTAIKINVDGQVLLNNT